MGKHLEHKAPNYGPYKTVNGHAHRCDTCAFCKKIASGLYGYIFKCVHEKHAENVCGRYGCDDWQLRERTGGRAKLKKSFDRFFGG